MSTLNTYTVHEFTIQPGNEITVEISGSYLSCLELSILLGSTEKPAVNVAIDNGSFQAFEPGLTFFTEGGEKFTAVRLQNPSATKVIDVKIAVGFGTLVDGRTIPALLPNPWGHVANARASFANVGLPALAANFSHLQILNPSGTGITYFVHRLTLFSTVAVSVQLYYYGNTALPTLASTGKSKQVNPSIGGLLEFRSEQRVTVIVSGLIHTIDVPANQLFKFPGLDIDAFEIRQGQSIVFVPTAQNVGLNLTAHYQEIPA